MPASILTLKGQTTIPKAVIDALGLKPSSRIVYRIDADRVVMEAADKALLNAYGSFERSDKKPLSPAEMKAGFRRSVADKLMRKKEPSP